MNNARVIISTHNTLAALGLKKLLSEVFSTDVLVVDESFFDVLSTKAEPHLFFVDQDTLVARLPFFLPRKAKTVLLLPSDQSIEDFRTVNTTLTESQLINEFNSLLEAHHKNDKESTALSSREVEVLRLISSGKTNKEIAQELNISINTVLTHRKNITAKLGIKSVSGLSFYAMMNGII